jgi:hypothetical protein
LHKRPEERQVPKRIEYDSVMKLNTLRQPPKNTMSQRNLKLMSAALYSDIPIRKSKSKHTKSNDNSINITVKVPQFDNNLSFDGK